MKNFSNKSAGAGRYSDKKKGFEDRKKEGGARSFEGGSGIGSFERKPYTKRSEGGFEERKPYAKRNEGGFEERKPYAKRNEGGFEERKPYAKRNEGGGESFKREGFGEGKSFGRWEEKERPSVFSNDGTGTFKKREYKTEEPSFKRTEKRPRTQRDAPEGDFVKVRFIEPGTDTLPRQSADYEDKKPLKRAKREESHYKGKYKNDTPKAPKYNIENAKTHMPNKALKNLRKAEEAEEESGGLVRLNRYIANSGVCSRRDADVLIQAGEIKVNGKIVTEMGFQVKPTDVVKYGNRILNREKLVYVLVNKPKDYITTTDDPQERRTVMDLVHDIGNYRLYPVGRLDRNTTGLIMLTNDGELAEKLAHPSNNIAKIYQVELDKKITQEHFDMLLKGITLEDGDIKADDLAIVTPDNMVIGIEVHSGRNRIVRRMFEHLGYEVLKLDRTTYAGLNKKDLPRGRWRFLTEKEVIRLKYLL